MCFLSILVSSLCVNHCPPSDEQSVQLESEQARTEPEFSESTQSHIYNMYIFTKLQGAGLRLDLWIYMTNYVENMSMHQNRNYEMSEANMVDLQEK